MRSINRYYFLYYLMLFSYAISTAHMSEGGGEGKHHDGILASALRNSDSPLLDAELDSIDMYVKIINDWRVNNTLSQASITALNADLTRALDLSTPKIESGRNFKNIEPAWLALQKEVAHIQESMCVTIPMMHLIGRKIIVLSDASQLSNDRLSEIYFSSRTGSRKVGNSLGMIHYFLWLLVGHTLWDTIEEFLLLDSLSDFRNTNRPSMAETIPLFSLHAVFGFEAFFEAFSHKLLIQSYPIFGSDAVHDGQFSSYQKYSIYKHDQNGKELLLKDLDKEDFLSSIVLANHDRLHMDRISLNFSRYNYKWYVAWIKALTTHEQLTKAVLQEYILVFFCTFEVDLPSPYQEMQKIIESVFKECPEEPSDNVRRSIMRHAHDFYKLFHHIGFKNHWNDAEPWRNGPQIKRLLNKAIEKSQFLQDSMREDLRNTIK